MARNNVKILSMLMLVFLIIGTNAQSTILHVAAQENTTISYDIYAEGIQVLYGENKAVGAVVFRIGGEVDVKFDIGDPAFNHIENIILTFGKGFDWTRYIHRPLWELPPGAMLILQYKAGAGFTEDDAVAAGFSAAELIGDAYGLEFHVLWEEFKNNIVSISFYAIMDDSDFNSFFEDVFRGILGSGGLMNLITVDAVTAAPYARLMLVIGKDRGDGDRDGDFSELIPMVGVAFVAEDAIVFNEDLELYEISINHIFQHSGAITWSNDSVWSVVEVKIPFPVRFAWNVSTPTNSSFPGVTGYYQYILHAKDPATGWEYNWPGTLDDIVIRYLPYNYTERMTRFPVLQAKFVAEPYPYSPTTKLTLKLEVKNVGNAFAFGTRAVIPLDQNAYEVLSELQRKGYFKPKDWELISIERHGETRYLLRTFIGPMAPNSTPIIKQMTFIFDETFDPTAVGGLIPFVCGPIVIYRDRFGVRYSIVANGFVYPISGNGTFVIPEISVETPTGASYVAVGSTVKVITNLTNYGGLPASNINVEVIHGILDEFGNIIEYGTIDKFHVDYLEDYYNGTYYSYERNVTYHVRARPGMHFVGAIITYEGSAVKNSSTTETFDFATGPIISNLVSMFVLPPARIRGRIFRYPLPHAEIVVNKTLDVDNETGKVKVRLEITNVGDINTTIIYIADFWNSSQVSFANNVTIDGIPLETGAYGSFTNDKIKVLYVVIGNENHPIELLVNQTIVVEYELNIKATGTFELISHPTIVRYDFGPYEMERETLLGEEEGSEEGFVAGSAFYAQGIKIMQETATSQFVQTFSQTLVELVSTISAPPTPTPPPSPRFPGPLILLIGVALVVIVASAIIIRRRRE